MRNNKYLCLVVLTFSILFSFLLCSGDTYAEYTISLNTSGAQSVDILPKAGESRVTNIGADNLTVSTTCKAGYYLTMSTSVSDNNLYLNGDSSNNSAGTYFSPADGTTTLGDSINTWGYLMSNSTPSTFSVFSAIPTAGNAVTLKNPAGTASQTDITDNINIYYGVSASSGLAPGTYKMIKDGNNNDGVITYYATMAEACNVYTITYNANSGNGSIDDQIVTKGYSLTLADNAFTRSDYYFKGWATSANGAVVYRPSQTITPTSDLNLYAVWGESINTTLYDAVESLTRGTQTLSGLRASITKKNSGVYTYNSSTFGVSSDESNDYPVYYYRGVIDTDFGDESFDYDENSIYGSTGNSYNYPNYVRLGDTCWRIIRTTGSGGVKMVYNGSFGATTSGSCGNSDGHVAVYYGAYASKGSSGVSNWYRNVNRVGYTFNDSSSIRDSSTSTSVDTVFGSNSNYSTTNTVDSSIKDYLENTWFDDAIGSFAGFLEPGAGYCNDRTAYSDKTGSIQLTSIVPYGTDTAYFGSSIRNTEKSNTLTLTCPRGTVDLYSTSAASKGNKQLKKPVALLTADERALAGNGNGSNYSSNYNEFSFLYSGSSAEVTMSPAYRSSSSTNVLTGSFGTGNIINKGINGASSYYRPVISLKYGVTPSSGSGIATDPWIITTPSIYENIASMSKGLQTNDTNTTTGIKVNPTAPTSSTTVSANSGVYEYNSSVFGADSDGTKSDGTKAKIFYYRGILDSYGNTNTYGSAGKSDAYPNYVILQAGDSKATTDTCWRIVRTTGSGGVKMIYNGTWTGSTCANSTNSARINSPVTTSTFNGTASTATQARQVVRTGYTHNSTYASTTSSNVAVGTLFGSDSDFSVNNTDSTIKGNIDTWFSSSSVSDFEGMLESNANYCNDRSAFTSDTGATATSSLYSYTTSTSGDNYAAYFGPYVRNITTNLPPSLGCSRSTVDRYSTSTSSGGNGQLSVPVSLLTADEASFAGSGSSNASQGSGYSTYSYLRTGNTFWTLSPSYRSGYAYGFYVNANGYLASSRIDTAYSIRPVISLKEGVAPTSGTGISTDPWVVKPKQKTINDLAFLQDFASLSAYDRTSVLDSMTTETSYILRDSRDNTEYHIAKLADGNVWLQDNLSLDLTDNSVKSTMLDSNDTKTNASYSNINTLLGAVTNSSSISSLTSPVININYKNNSVTKYGSGSGKIGIFYNYCAASVNVQCHQASSTNGSDGYGIITQDICPKGWKMPAASSTGEYQSLYNSYSDDSSFLSALSVALSGYYGTSIVGQNEFAYYLSTGPTYSMNRIGFLPALYASSDAIESAHQFARSNGSPIRCLLAPAS